MRFMFANDFQVEELDGNEENGDGNDVNNDDDDDLKDLENCLAEDDNAEEEIVEGQIIISDMQIPNVIIDIYVKTEKACPYNFPITRAAEPGLF